MSGLSVGDLWDSSHYGPKGHGHVGVEVILRMDWLTAYRVIIDCDRKRVTTCTQDGTCFIFQGDKHNALPQAMYDSKWHGQLMRWLTSLTLEDKVR